MENAAAEIATLKETVRGLNREIRDLKSAHKDSAQSRTVEMKALTDEVEAMRLAMEPLRLVAPRLTQLLIEADRQDGFKSAAKTILGGGMVAALAAALAGIYEFFSKGAG